MKKGKNIPGKLEFHDEKTEKEAEFHTDDMLRTGKATVKEKILLDAAKTLNDLKRQQGQKRSKEQIRHFQICFQFLETIFCNAAFFATYFIGDLIF